MWKNIRNSIKTVIAIKKSKAQANIDANGKTSRGKYILVINSLFPTRLFTENFTELTKKVHGRTLIEIEIIPINSNGLLDMDEIAAFTRTPDKTATIGMNIAHKKPMAACLYLILISLKVSMNKRSRYFIISFNILSPFSYRMILNRP